MASLVQRPGRPTWYIQFYLSGKLRRVSTGTDSYQISKEKLRQFESAQAGGDALPLLRVLRHYWEREHTDCFRQSRRDREHHICQSLQPSVVRIIQLISIFP